MMRRGGAAVAALALATLLVVGLVAAADPGERNVTSFAPITPLDEVRPGSPHGGSDGARAALPVDTSTGVGETSRTPGAGLATPSQQHGGPIAPQRVRIPRIGVDAAVIDLGINPDGSLEVPSDFGLTGWFTGRAVPGEVGPSIVVGHVDSRSGPAVFYRLRDLDVGDLVQIERSDGLDAWFRVSEVVLVEKDEFPTEAVYGATDESALRLITCGGSFDSDERSYLGNLIVYAEHLGNVLSSRPVASI